MQGTRACLSPRERWREAYAERRRGCVFNIKALSVSPCGSTALPKGEPRGLSAPLVGSSAKAFCRTGSEK